VKIFKINDTRDLQATVEKALREVDDDKSFALQWPNGTRLIFNGDRLSRGGKERLSKLSKASLEDKMRKMIQDWITERKIKKAV
jgi:hypothetical protein